MRIFAPLAAMMLLAACGDPNAATERALAEAGDEAADNGRVECAVDGAGGFARVCTIERVTGDGGTILTLRHPGGGFRRLQIVTDGRGVIAADGADQAEVAVREGGEIEVALAGDRYRLPATVKGAANPQ